MTSPVHWTLLVETGHALLNKTHVFHLSIACSALGPHHTLFGRVQDKNQQFRKSTQPVLLNVYAACTPERGWNQHVIALLVSSPGWACVVNIKVGSPTDVKGFANIIQIRSTAAKKVNTVRCENMDLIISVLIKQDIE